MANLEESETWEEGVYQIELGNAVIGGPTGIANIQAKQLANRTNWLKAAITAITGTTFTAAKAVKLATARMINGVEFDGSANITITADPNPHTHNYQPIGDYQPHNTKLDALAALTLAANKMLYATDANTLAVATLTAFARTLLAGADATAMKTTLGIIDGVGVNQTLQDVTSSRALGTTYTNSTGKPIMVIMQNTHAANNSWSITINGFTFQANGYGSTASTSFIVPNGATYSIGSGTGLGIWLELR